MSIEKEFNRRGFFSRVADGLQGAALAYLLGRDLFDGDRRPLNRCLATIHASRLRFSTIDSLCYVRDTASTASTRQNDPDAVGRLSEDSGRRMEDPTHR